jgi:hypothetical protein
VGGEGQMDHWDRNNEHDCSVEPDELDGEEWVEWARWITRLMIMTMIVP